MCLFPQSLPNQQPNGLDNVIVIARLATYILCKTIKREFWSEHNKFELNVEHDELERQRGAKFGPRGRAKNPWVPIHL